MRSYAFYPTSVRLGQALSQKHPDLDLHLVLLDVLLPKVCQMVPPESVVCCVPLAPYLRPTTLEGQRSLEVRRNLLRRCKRVITPCEYSYYQVKAWLDRDVDVVPHVAIDFAAAEEALNLTCKVQSQVCHVTRLHEKKRWMDGVHACQLAARGGSLQYVLQSRMTTMARGDADKEKWRLLASSRVGLQPSAEEALSGVPGEYVAAGAIPVISRLPGYPGCYSGFPSHEVGNVGEMASLIQRAISGEFDEQVSEWRERVKKEMDLPVRIARMSEYLESIV